MKRPSVKQMNPKTKVIPGVIVTSVIISRLKVR